MSPSSAAPPGPATQYESADASGRFTVSSGSSTFACIAGNTFPPTPQGFGAVSLHYSGVGPCVDGLPSIYGLQLIYIQRNTANACLNVGIFLGNALSLYFTWACDGAGGTKVTVFVDSVCLLPLYSFPSALLPLKCTDLPNVYFQGQMAGLQSGVLPGWSIQLVSSPCTDAPASAPNAAAIAVPIVAVALLCAGAAGFFVWRRRASASGKALSALRSAPAAVAPAMPASTNNPLMQHAGAAAADGPSDADVAQANAGLPSGWAAVWSKSKSAFYWRAAGGDTTWTKPV